jgi:hypothetical protein
MVAPLRFIPMSLDAQPPKGFLAKIRWVLTYATLWMIPLVALERFADEHYTTGWVFTGLFVANLIIVSIWDPVAGMVSRKGPRMLQMLSIIGIAAGAILFAGCVIWMLVDIRSKHTEISRALARYVLPRHLDKDTSAAADILKKAQPPSKINFVLVKNNNEASLFHEEIRKLLSDSNWKMFGTIDYSDDLREGLTIECQTPNNVENPGSALVEALAAVGVRVDNPQLGSGSTVNETVMTIKVGHRRADDADDYINSRINQSIENMRKQLRK